MAALNPPGSLPSEVQVILGLLITAKGKRLSRHQIDRLVSPASLALVSSAGSLPAESETMVVCRSTGLVRRDGEDLVLGEAVAVNLAKGHEGSVLRTAIRRTLFTTVSPKDARTSNDGAGDLARAAAWFLLQDTWAPRQGWDGPQGWEDLQQRQLSKEHQTLINATRWGALDRWLPYLGLAVHDPRDAVGRSSGQLLVPDPTGAVREELGAILPRAGMQRSLKAALGDLVATCPVLDGGIYHSVVRDRITPGTLPSVTGALSPSLSHALRRLHDTREFELLDRADAEKVLLSTLEEPVPFSHIVRVAS